MKRFCTLFSFFLVHYFGQCQTMTFEALNLPIDTFWNGSDQSGRYIEQMTAGLSDTFIAFNQYDTSFGGFWSGGFAISTMTDDSTGNYTNLYSSIAGSGYNSDAYGVVLAADTAFIQLSHNIPMYEPRIMSMYVSNTTYAYYSMLNGDAFAKKFGGSSGDDPDYFFIRFYFEYGIPDSYVDFYLADFRSSDNNQDYILDEWVYVDLNDYPNSEYVGNTIKMQVFSSDTGVFGMNTPAFFCMDDMQIAYPSGISDDDYASPNLELSVKQKSINAAYNEVCDFQIMDLSGRVFQSILSTKEAKFNTELLPKGVYIIQARNSSLNVATKVWRW